MYINDRGHINYHGFVRATRDLLGANLKKASEGLCTDSEWSRVEIGDRLPEKLMRDRMVGRLGISGEEYEEYLRPEEYRQWEIRMYIIEHLNMCDVEGVERGIQELERIPKQNPVQQQFTDTMRYMLAQIQGVSDEILSMMIELAVVHTIPSIEYAFKGTQLLSDQELNLIAEYARVYDYQGETDIREWRFDLYKKILAYVDDSIMDQISRVKIYPRVTCLICELLFASVSTEGEIRYAYEMCNKSVELLRDTNRLYYFIELMECRKKIIERILAFDDLGIEERENLKLVYDKDTEWEDVLRELYEEYSLPVYMQNFTYLYVETECESAVEVIRTRRNMYKLSRVRVSEDICTEKTVERFENYSNSPTIVVIREIFNRIGLCPEYRRAKIITHDAKLLELNNLLERHLSNEELEKAQQCLAELESQLDMTICFNQQEIKKMANRIEILKGEQDEKSLYKNALKALECTIPFGNVIRKEDKFFTRSEIECLHTLAFKVKGEVSGTCYEILKRICEHELGKPFSSVRFRMLEPIMTALAYLWGQEENYKEAYHYSERLVKESLKHYRMNALVDGLYNKVWVYEILSKPHNIPIKSSLITKSLKDCILLVEIGKWSKWTKFLQEKLAEYIQEEQEYCKE